MADNCGVLVHSNVPQLTAKQLDNLFDRKTELEMISSMQAIFQSLTNGEDVDAYILPIIKNVSTSQSKTLKRILHMFWPMVDCFGPDGKTKPFMILICNSLTQDIQHPNEYIICSALRCLMNFNVKDVLQHIVQAIPPLLTHISPEVRSTAAIAIKVINEKFLNLVRTDLLLQQFIDEKNQHVMRNLIIAVSSVDEAYYQRNSAFIDSFDFLRQDHQVGVGVFDNFMSLTGQVQLQIINQLRVNLEGIPGTLLYSAGRALIHYARTINNDQFLILAAQCLLQSCNGAPEAAVLQIIQVIEKLDLQNVPGAAIVSATLAAILCGSNQTPLTQIKLFKSKIFQKICGEDTEAAKKVVDSLSSSRIIETEFCDLYYELLNTVQEVAKVCDGFSGISVVGLQQLMEICLRDISTYNLLEKASGNSDYKKSIYEDAGIISINILKQAACANINKHEYLKLLVKVLFQTTSEEIYRASLWAFVELSQGSEQEIASVFYFALPMPQSIEIEVSDFVKSAIGIAFNKKEEDSKDNDQDVDNPPVYLQVKNGKISFLTTIMCQLVNRVVFELDHLQHQHIISRLLLGVSHLIKRTQKMVESDKVIALNCVQQLYQYASEGGKPDKNIVVHKTRVTTNVRKQKVDAIQSLNFSMFPSNKIQETLDQQEPKQQQFRKQKPMRSMDILQEDPQLIFNVYQLSADADLVYCEALALINKTQIVLHVLFINRSDEPVQDLELELFASASLRVQRNAKKLNIEPHQQAYQTYQLSITSCETATIFGNIVAKFQQKKVKGGARFRDAIMRIKEIQFDVKHFIKGIQIRMPEFRRLWSVFEYEFRVSLSDVKQADKYVQKLQDFINFQVVQADQIDDVGQGCLCCQSLTGEIVLCVYNLSDQGLLKIRSQSRLLAQSVAHSIRLIVE